MSEQIKCDRSYMHNSSMAIAIAVTIIAALILAMSGLAEAQPSGQNAPTSNGSFGPIKQIDAGLLNVGYVEAGPTDGTPVILLHGWPYDIYSYVDVAPLLASKGYHVFVPYLRGYGTTRLLSDDTFRNGQPSVVAVDTGGRLARVPRRGKGGSGGLVCVAEAEVGGGLRLRPPIGRHDEAVAQRPLFRF